MPRRLKVNLHEFYYSYAIEKMSAKEIMERYHISKPTYDAYVQRVKGLKLDISTEFLERELMIAYHRATDSNEKAKILDQMIKVWERKHKIPKEKEEEPTIDFTQLLGGGINDSSRARTNAKNSP